ncbi:aspartate--tRNA(Asn) ligase, partial [archaeon]
MERTYTKDVTVDKPVLLKGWVHDVRVLGGISFLVLRDGHGTVQVTAPKGKVPEKVAETIQKLHQEDLIEVKGTGAKSRAKNIAVEVIPESITVLNRSETPLPLDPRRVTKANLDTRLDWRVLDLRSPENLAVFKIQAKLIEGMEEYLRKNGFVQVFTPSLLGGTSEGGSEVFPVVYFDKEAYLRQDPQLHRELLIAAGFD